MDSPDAYLLAQMIDEKPNYCVWLTEIGVAIRTGNSGNYSRNDYALVSVNDYGTGDMYGLIRGRVIGDSNEKFSKESSRHDCIRAFAESTVEPVYARQEEETKELSPVLLRLLLRRQYLRYRLLLSLLRIFLYQC